MDNILFLAGNIGLYGAKLELVDSNSISKQYIQAKHNFNRVIRNSTNDHKIVW